MSLPYGYVLTRSGTRLHDNILEEKRREAKKWLDEVEKSFVNGLIGSRVTVARFRSKISFEFLRVSPFGKIFIYRHL